MVSFVFCGQRLMLEINETTLIQETLLISQAQVLIKGKRENTVA